MSELVQFSAPVDIQAAKGEGKRPAFEIVAYTGIPMQTGAFYTPVIVELSGVKTVNPQIPILLDHDPSRIVGQGTAKVDAVIRVSGEVMGEDADSQKVTTLARNGFKWQASIGAQVTRREFLEAGKKAFVNGREVTGPLMIARESILSEVSFVAIGADQQTSAAVAASHSARKGNDMNFEAWLTAKGIDPAKLEEGAVRATLKAAYDAEQKPAPAPVVPAAPPTVTAGNTPNKADYGSLEEIFAGNKVENARRSEITRITAEALRDFPHLGETLEAAAKKAIDDKTSPTEYELAVLRACRPQSGSRVNGRSSNATITSNVIEAALCRSVGLPNLDKQFDDRTLTACDAHFRDGIGLKELIIRAANDRGANLHSISGDSSLSEALHYAFPTRQELRASSGFSTISLPNILANVQNKSIRVAFMAVESAWRDISVIAPVNDFKAVSRNSLTGDLQYERVTATGEIPHGTLSERNYANQAKTYGKMLAITRENIINDDVGAFNQVPRRLGRGAALKINDVFWTEFLANSTFFTTGNSNYDDGTDTALDTAGLTKALGTFWYAQTDPDGKPLGAEPVILLVPPAQYIPALNLNNASAMNPSGQTSSTALVPNNNPFAAKFRVVKSTYLANSSYTGYSALAWYLLCDPNDIPVIEVCFLGGREMPIVETADADFDQLGIKIRAYHDFGVAKQEFRGGMKFKGEA